jgi:EAL domain-containing protein (putative c-di-GMP-specific phosphodiesterase class I)
MLTDPADEAMVRAINQIGHTMGKQTIAEWAESNAIVSRLQDLGVDYAQGYAVGRPCPINDLLEQLAKPQGLH